YESIGKDGLKEKILEEAKSFYKRKEEMLGHELMARLERYAVLSVIDDKWKEHLREMDDLKEGIGLRAYGQKDPLIEYKSEGFKLFVQLLERLRNDTISFCFKFFPAQPDEVQQRRQKPMQRITTIKDSVTNLGMQGSGQQDEGGRRGKVQPIVRQEEKVGRNDPCPCGSGKKFKNCHGRT
ncbi:MAG: preprotein translocase subunit SecA, partial [Ignavibacteriales bacterium]